MTEIEKRLTDVLLKDASSGGGDDASDVKARDDKSDALRQIEGERKELSESRKLLEALLAKTKDRSKIIIKNVNMRDGGRVVAGLINADGKYADARINIDNVEATSSGQGVVGIVQGIDLNAFFK